MYVRLSLVFFLCVFVKFEAFCENDQPLIVTPLLQQGKHMEAQRLARVQSDKFPSSTAYSGYFQVDIRTNSNLFFWFFPSERKQTDPVLLCLQGGPGISSLLWLFLENGPYYINPNGNLERRNHSWTKTNSILYIDSPTDVGFSITERIDRQSLSEVTENLLEAVKQFFQMFPKLRTNDFYIVGESYGGMYAPSLANKIHNYNQNVSVTTRIKLKGVGIGNGLTDSKHQNGYGDILYQLGFINDEIKRTFGDLEEKKKQNIDNQNWLEIDDVYMEMFDTLHLNTGYDNVYNLLHSTTTRFNEETLMENYLNQEAVRRALHVGSTEFTAYIPILLSDNYKPAPEMVESLLNKNYQVLIYTGQFDFVIAYVTVINYLKELKYCRTRNFFNSPKRIWKVNDEIAGYVRQVGVLNEVMVRNAGHMVAMDKGEWVYDLMDRFTHNRPLWD